MSEPQPVPEIDAAELAAHPEVLLIDVRQPDEYETAHVAGAILIPLAEVPERIDEVPADTPIHVICQTGARSRKASEFLIAQGIDATNVGGGTSAWIEAGQPVTSGPEPG